MQWKSVLSAACLSAVAVSAAWASEAVAAAPGYLIMCKGGPFKLEHFGNDALLAIHFKWAKIAGGNGSKLNPGECSWQDRTARKDEPNMILVPVRRHIWIKWDAQSGAVSGTDFFDEPASGSMMTPPEGWKTGVKQGLEALGDPQRVSVFRVTSGGKLSFTVEKFKDWVTYK